MTIRRARRIPSESVKQEEPKPRVIRREPSEHKYRKVESNSWKRSTVGGDNYTLDLGEVGKVVIYLDTGRKGDLYQVFFGKTRISRSLPLEEAKITGVRLARMVLDKAHVALVKAEIEFGISNADHSIYKNRIE